MCDEWLTEIIEEATAGVGEEYFHLKIDGGDPIYRERVYCYELYHQVRRLWPTDTPFLVQGEISKSRHPKLLPGLWKTPDFLIHTPGDMKGNYTIIEVKHSKARNENIDDDLEKLSLFQSQVGYQRAIYLVYGDEAAHCAKRVIDRAERFQELDPIELWLHEKSGEPAACHTKLPTE